MSHSRSQSREALREDLQCVTGGASLRTLVRVLPPKSCNPDHPCTHHGHCAYMTYHVNGIELHVTEQGPQTRTRGGGLVILLHGFPGSWYMWSEQLHDLGIAGKGYCPPPPPIHPPTRTRTHPAHLPLRILPKRSFVPALFPSCRK
jgi:hypothetical protein